MDKQLFYKQLCEEEVELRQTVENFTSRLEAAKQTLGALQILKKMYVAHPPLNAQPGLFEASHPAIVITRTIRSSVKKKGGTTVKEKVLSALKNVGIGTLKDVTNQLLVQYPDYEERRAYLDAKHYLSRLNTSGEISSEKSGKGKGYLFAIKE